MPTARPMREVRRGGGEHEREGGREVDVGGREDGDRGGVGAVETEDAVKRKLVRTDEVKLRRLNARRTISTTDGRGS